MTEIVVSLKNINKRYWLSFTKQSLIGNFLSIFRAKKSMESKKEICALKDIELCIKKGETVGIIGENASGKTTILRIISRITVPTKGELRVQGKVAGLLDLGAGFHGELTGKENVYLDAAMYGMSREEIDEVYERIVEFSGLGDFIYAQVKTYSQGMLVRLGFSIAIHVDPDIFLIDDSLAVGDEEFQRKCLNKIFKLKEQGKTIIVVSHDLDSISRICERGILLKSGKIVKDDSMHKVVMRYIEAVGDKNSIASLDKGRISVIFNNGKIILLWDGKPITKNFGGYASLQILDKWVMSWGAKWQVVENTKDLWKVVGVLDKYGLKLELACLLENENLMNFNFKLEVPKQVSLKNTGFGFMVCDKYDRYLREQSVEEIEKIDKTAKEWTDIYRTDEYNASLILLGRDEMPVLKMNFSGHDCAGFSLIQNTTKELGARIMQTQMNLPTANVSSRADCSTIECNCRLEILSTEDFDGFMRKRIQDSAIESAKLKVRVNDKGLQIFYDGIELTKNEGMSVGFYHKKRFFNLFSGSWNLTKETADSMIICAQFKEMGLDAKLSLYLADNCLKWHMDLRSYKAADECRLITRLYLIQKFKKYFSGEPESEFSPAGEYTEKINLVPRQTDFIGLMAEKNELPLLVLEAPQSCQLQLQNAGIDSPGRILVQETSGMSANGQLLFMGSPEQKSGFLSDKKQKHDINTVLKNDQLRIESSENNIDIYSGNSRITAGEGFSSGVHFNGRWYESTHLKKQITKEGETLKVLIERRLPRLSELWEISLSGGKINWIVKIRFAEKITGMNYKAGIILKSDYGQWAHSFDEGSFDDQRAKNKVVDLDDANIALLGARSVDCSFPAVFFERIRSNVSGVIIQKEENKCCLQFKLKNANFLNNQMEKLFSGRISLQEEKSWGDNLLNHRKDEFSLETSDGLQLFAATQGIKLLADGKELTQAKGLAVALVCEDGDSDTNFASWTLKKTSPHQIETQMDWGNSTLKQRWKFELMDDAIQWTVLLDVKNPILLRELFVNMFPQKHFGRWQSKNDGGEIDCKETRGKAVTIFDNRSEILNVLQDRISPETPGLKLNLLVDMQKWFLHIHNNEKGGGIACGAHYLSDPEGVRIEPGENEIFKARISLVKDINTIQMVEAENEADTYVLELGRLKVKIGKAKMRLFWDNKELTKKLGMFTAFSINDKRIDSTLAKWDVRATEHKITVRLNWSVFFVAQIWEVELLSEHEFLWDVRTEIKQTGINMYAAALMLSDEYERYKSDDKQESCFPDKFEPDLWINIVKSKDPVEVNSKQADLPNIIFDAVIDKHVFSNNVENSDILHSSRVLICETQGFEIDGKTELHISSRINISIQE